MSVTLRSNKTTGTLVKNEEAPVSPLIQFLQRNSRHFIELPLYVDNLRHLVVEMASDLVRWFKWAASHGYTLCTMVPTDERALEAACFKLYYMFSAPDEDLILVVEYALSDPQHLTEYPSIAEYFKAGIPFEREIADLFGLTPLGVTYEAGFILKDGYPPNLNPMWADKSVESLMAHIAMAREQTSTQTDGKPLPGETVTQAPGSALPTGASVLVVGPIHAGVIEAGHFPFQIAGEVIEELPPLEYHKHRGLEKLFETEHSLATGWRLAECVSGDACFSYSLAYCRAVEALISTEMVAPKAECWRGLFLELERLYNHVGNVATIVHDIAYDAVAAPLMVLREGLVDVNYQLTGHRYLRGINRPGGVIISPPADRTLKFTELQSLIEDMVAFFAQKSQTVLEMQWCRDRFIGTGVLTQQEALDLGASGIGARASAFAFADPAKSSGTPEQVAPLREKAMRLLRHDFRIKHPQGIYRRYPELQRLLAETIVLEEPRNGPIAVPVDERSLQGDVFARLALRIAEASTSALIIKFLLSGPLADDLAWLEQGPIEYLSPVIDSLRRVPNFQFGIGMAESWRGDLIVFLMKGPGGTIFRCKLRDPSVLNWPALTQSIIRKTSESDSRQIYENIIADFPVHNASWNLLYALS